MRFQSFWSFRKSEIRFSYLSKLNFASAKSLYKMVNQKTISPSRKLIPRSSRHGWTIYWFWYRKPTFSHGEIQGNKMHNLLETSNWALSETSCFVMDKGFGDIKSEKSERVPLKYIFVMEKSWQSSNSSRLMRNVRRSVHQVNVNYTT